MSGSTEQYDVLGISPDTDVLPAPALIRPVGEDRSYFGWLVGQVDAPGRMIDEMPVLQYEDPETGLTIQLHGIECAKWELV